MQCPKMIVVRGDDIVPCGYCYVCRTNRMSDWVIRLTHEQKQAVSSYFVTLTYDEYNLPINDNGDSCLVKRDLQLWLKRLRKHSTLFSHYEYTERKGKTVKKRCYYSVRYYAVGEYGTRFGRAHYHVLLFSTKPIDYVVLRDTWSKGFIYVGKVNTKSIKYCAKYVFSNKGDGGKDRPPQFALMSRRPGIGFYTIKFLKKQNFLYVNGFKKRLPRYYKDKLLTKQEKEVLKEQTLKEVERLYNEGLDYLRSKGYQDPVTEYALREQALVNKVVRSDNSKLKF